MSNQDEKELIESMEKLKEISRIQYDYFKHFSTLSASSILIIIAFLEKIFSRSNCIIFAGISIFSFLLCLLGSVWILPETGNTILYMTGARLALTIITKNSEKEVKNIKEKFKNSLKKIKFYDWFTRITFLVGIIMFLVFAFINFSY